MRLMGRLLIVVVSVFVLHTAACSGGLTSLYVRNIRPSVDIPLEYFTPPPGYNAPEQVHLTQGDHDGRAVIISWVTPLRKYPNEVRVWEADTINDDLSSIRHKNNTITYNTKYFYELGKDDSKRRFFFTTPPKIGRDSPYTFGIIGDLGQTYDSNDTFHHYHLNPKGQAVLFAGDLSYADDHPFHDNRKWDTFGRFIEKSAAYQAWIWAPGNHELDYAPEIGEYVPFKPYKHRYHVPFRASNSTSPLWYSIKRASAYIIVLSSYSAYGKYTPQYRWLEDELPKVNREETPWLIVILHSPWYNSNNYHYMEGESMRVTFEPWFVQHNVDLVIAGHVHSYERTERVSNVKYNITNGESTPVKDPCAPVYITIGDGGNIEGIAKNFTEPQPSYSAYREASFGYAMLEIKNHTHAHYTWHRNQDREAVASDSIWFYNRYSYANEENQCS